jgi:hypothetical protein
VEHASSTFERAVVPFLLGGAGAAAQQQEGWSLKGGDAQQRVL